MEKQFYGTMLFESVDVSLLKTPRYVLERHGHELDFTNAPFLAGKAPKPHYRLERLDNKPKLKLPNDWSDENSALVVGDLSEVLSGMPSIIIARTSNFKTAGELAEMMGYLPAKAGQFIQILGWLAERKSNLGGWYFCYEGRTPNYAILAKLHEGSLDVTFDTHTGNQIEEDDIHANADTYAIFVRQ